MQSRALGAAALLCFVGLLACITNAAETSLGLTLLSATDPRARCNDGSPGGFYWKAGTDKSLWLLYLGGGGWCYNEARPSCIPAAKFNATPALMSSKSWAWSIKKGGIFDDNVGSNPMANANKVFVGYCSSDAWLGSAAASAATFGFAFQGPRILQAVLTALVQTHGLGADDLGTRLVVGGCDMGGVGAMFATAVVPTVMQGLRITNVSTMLLLDDALWADISPFNLSETSLQAQAQSMLAVVNGTGSLDPGCLALNPAATWKCIYAQYHLPYVSIPYAIGSPQFDKRQLQYDIGSEPPYVSASSSAYLEEFQAVAVAAAQSLPTTDQMHSSLMYSPACFASCSTYTARFWESSLVAGTGEAPLSFAQAVSAWLDNNINGLGAGQFIESCDGLNCGSGCAETRPTHKAAGGQPQNQAWLQFQNKSDEDMDQVNYWFIAALFLGLLSCVYRRMRKSRLCDVDGMVQNIMMKERVTDPEVPAGRAEYKTFKGGSGREVKYLAAEAAAAGEDDEQQPPSRAPSRASNARTPSPAPPQAGGAVLNLYPKSKADSSYRLDIATDFSR